MARDYRYGHKTKAPIERRTQKDDGDMIEAGSQEAKPVDRRHMAKRAMRDRLPEKESTAAVVVDQKKTTSHAGREDVKKLVANTCSACMPRAIRREVAAQEQYAREQAELAAQQAALKAVQVKEKKHSRWNASVLISMSSLVLLGIAWLLYAPFFLAFAVNMHWIDEQTSQKVDAVASVRAKVAASNEEAKQQSGQMQQQAAKLPNELRSEESKENLQYTFYKELSETNVQVGVQPLPVRTKSPTYLQLASFTNEKEAQAERKRLAIKGQLVQMTTQVNARKQTNYVLRMGPFDDQRTINKLKVDLQKLGVDAHEVSVTNLIKSLNKDAVQLPE